MIESKVEERKTQQPGIFPRLMIHSTGAVVVMFTDDFCGMVLSSSTSDWKVGDTSTSMNIDSFRDFHGTITITA